MTDTERQQVAAVLREIALSVDVLGWNSNPLAERLVKAWTHDWTRAQKRNLQYDSCAARMRAVADRVERGEL